jgi:hypothetical protein
MKKLMGFGLLALSLSFAAAAPSRAMTDDEAVQQVVNVSTLSATFEEYASRISTTPEARREVMQYLEDRGVLKNNLPDVTSYKNSFYVFGIFEEPVEAVYKSQPKPHVNIEGRVIYLSGRSYAEIEKDIFEALAGSSKTAKHGALLTLLNPRAHAFWNSLASWFGISSAKASEVQRTEPTQVAALTPPQPQAPVLTEERKNVIDAIRAGRLKSIECGTRVDRNAKKEDVAKDNFVINLKADQFITSYRITDVNPDVRGFKLAPATAQASCTYEVELDAVKAQRGSKNHCREPKKLSKAEIAKIKKKYPKDGALRVAYMQQLKADKIIDGVPVSAIALGCKKEGPAFAEAVMAAVSKPASGTGGQKPGEFRDLPPEKQNVRKIQITK